MNFVFPYSWKSFQKRLNQAEKDGSSPTTWKVFTHKLWIFKPSDPLTMKKGPQGRNTPLQVPFMGWPPESH